VRDGHPQPGWYADPLARHDARWWDGGAWTIEVRDATARATPSPRTVAMPAPTPVPTAVRLDRGPYPSDPYERFGTWFLLGMIPVLMAFLAYSSWLLAGAGR